MTIDVQSILKTGAAATDAALERLLPAATIEPHSIHRAMRHSTFAGGKRLRPILCMEATRCVAGEDGEGFAEDDVARWLAAAEVVVIERGQVVVDQRIGVQHFDCRAQIRDARG